MWGDGIKLCCTQICRSKNYGGMLAGYAFPNTQKEMT